MQLKSSVDSRVACRDWMFEVFERDEVHVHIIGYTGVPVTGRLFTGTTQSEKYKSFMGLGGRFKYCLSTSRIQKHTLDWGYMFLRFWGQLMAQSLNGINDPNRALDQALRIFSDFWIISASKLYY